MIKINFFVDPIKQISKWLNCMADRGYRLVSVNGCVYKFEKSDIKYKYASQFVGGNSYSENKKYINMCKEFERCNVFTVPINQGNFNLGKFRLRLFGKKSGKIATSFGNYNREIMVVEFEENDYVDLLTNNKDLANEYKDLKNSYLQGLVGVLVLFLYTFYKIYLSDFSMMTISLFVILIILTVLILKNYLIYNKNYKTYKLLSEIEE